MDLSQYSEDQLAQLKHQIESELEGRVEQKRKLAIDSILAAANDADISREDIIKALTGRSKGATGRKAPIKFRDPANADNTWSGRGRKPLWVVAYLDQGHSMESLAV
ncbi:H-NS histone family protein [Litorivicinus lipolyticus]|uniref:H-NS histone family protein n=1 Tax=Litorivicinus lipolyticus TaxID=418701 RepID=A0A5Q2Q8R1_9GAMM|nr:H-NS histone family protein [Litorivicinus lipolyticus]QGG80548.1 H-NS histone family protein [Litorivicinus lipolyticus]